MDKNVSKVCLSFLYIQHDNIKQYRGCTVHIVKLLPNDFEFCQYVNQNQK